MLQSTGIALTAGLAGCSSGGSGGGSPTASGGDSDTESDDSTEESSGTTVGSSGDEYESVTFLETPAETPGDTEEMWEPFREYLQSEVDGLELEVQFADNTSAIGQSLINNQAEMTRSDIVLLANPDQIDVVGIVEEGGAAVYFSGLATLPDSDIEETTDIEDRTIAFADRPSTSGSLYPNYMLSQAGLSTGEAPYGDPVGYNGEWTGSHRNAVETLINREDVVACGCDIAVLLNHIPEDQWPERVRERSGRWDDDVGTESPELELVQASTSLPFSPIIARSNWEHPLRSEIEEAIVSIESGTLREPDGDVENPLTAVTEASIDDYQPVIDVINTLDVDLGQL